MYSEFLQEICSITTGFLAIIVLLAFWVGIGWAAYRGIRKLISML